jgi:metal-sulfur cluster biosynthetic enzyme
MTSSKNDELLGALRKVFDPCSIACNVPMDIVEMGLVKQSHVDEDGAAHVKLVLTSITCFQVPTLKEAIQDSVRESGVSETVVVTVDHDELWGPELMLADARSRVDKRRQESRSLTGARPRQWQDETGAEVSGRQ